MEPRPKSHHLDLQNPLRAPISVQKSKIQRFYLALHLPISFALLQPQWPPGWLRYSANFHPGPLPGCLSRYLCGSFSHFLYTCPSGLVKLLSLKIAISVVFTLLSRFFIRSPGHLTQHILHLLIIITFTTCLFPPHKLSRGLFLGEGNSLLGPR